jgi:hypothetical protein
MDEAPDFDTIYQQIEILKRLAEVREERGVACARPNCSLVEKGKVPEKIRNRGLFGPDFVSPLAMLKTVCNASFRNIKVFLSGTFGVDTSIGCLTQTIIKASGCLADAYEQIKSFIPTRAGDLRG